MNGIHIGRVDFNPSFHFAFQCTWGNFDDSERFITRKLADERIDITHEGHLALRMLAANGLNKSLRLILNDPRSDPGAADNDAIVIAAQHGHTETVRMLMDHPMVDPNARNNQALIYAIRKQYYDIVKLLLPTITESNEFNSILAFTIRWYVTISSSQYDTLLTMLLDYAYQMEIVIIHPTINRIPLDYETPGCCKRHKLFYNSIERLDNPQLTQTYSRATQRIYKKVLIDVAFGLKSLNLPVLVQHTIVNCIFRNMPQKYILKPTIAWEISKLVHLKK